MNSATSHLSVESPVNGKWDGYKEVEGVLTNGMGTGQDVSPLRLFYENTCQLKQTCFCRWV